MHGTCNALFAFWWGADGNGDAVSVGVVPVDEGTRVCGERSTTPEQQEVGSGPGAWCSSTKE